MSAAPTFTEIEKIAQRAGVAADDPGEITSWESIPPSEAEKVENVYFEKITAAWQKSVEGILEVGRLLLQAKADPALGSTHFGHMIRSYRFPFSWRTAQRLMKIASHEVLGDATHVSRLPASWGTLHELSKLTPKQARHALSNHWIEPDMERADAEALRKRLARTIPTPKPDASVEPEVLEADSAEETEIRCGDQENQEQVGIEKPITKTLICTEKVFTKTEILRRLEALREQADEGRYREPGDLRHAFRKLRRDLGLLQKEIRKRGIA